MPNTQRFIGKSRLRLQITRAVCCSRSVSRDITYIRLLQNFTVLFNLAKTKLNLKVPFVI